MCSVVIKELDTLSYEEVKKIISTSQHLKLKDATAGPQPKDSFIIGNIRDHKKKKSDKRGIVLKKCIFEEVVRNGILHCFEAFFYGEFADSIEVHLQKIGDSSPLWMSFSNVVINKYTGVQDPWAPFSLKIVAKDKDVPEIIILVQSKKPKEKLMTYESINEVAHGRLHNVFAAVKEIVKETKTIENGNRHKMISLVDPSCNEPASERPNLILHIFLNDSTDHFPEQCEVGDVLRIKMKGDLYKKGEEKMYGKIYSSRAVVKFSFKDDFRYVTSNKNYRLTEQDREKAKSLHDWWTKYEEDEEAAFAKQLEEAEQPASMLRKIEDVTTPSTFHIYCSIQALRAVPAHEITILRIVDGTCSKVCTTKIPLDMATQDLSSQTDHAVIGSPEIDVAVFGPPVVLPPNLKVGDFVELKNVKCVDMSPDTGPSPILDFSMNEKDCRIVKLFSNCSIANRIRKRIEGKECEQESDEKINIFVDRIVNDKSLLDSDTSTNCVNKGSPAKTNGVVERAVLCSPLREGRTPPSFGAEKGVLSSTPKAAKKATTKDVVPIVSSEEEGGVGAVPSAVQGTSNAGQDSPVIPTTGPSVLNESYNIKEPINLDLSVTEDQAEDSVAPNTLKKRSLDGETEGSSHEAQSEPAAKKLRKLSWVPRHVFTDCGKTVYPKMPLAEFCRNSKAGDFCTVWALLRHIHISSSEPPFQECDCAVVCFHDWIWGLCNVCGCLVSPSEMRRRYTKGDMMFRKALSCSNAACRGESDDDPEGGTVDPFMKLELCLEDLVNEEEFQVDLNGDGANTFFGVPPSFRWTIGLAPASLQEKVLSFKRSMLLRPIQLCLTNYSKSDSTTSIQVVSTSTYFLAL